LARNLGPDTPWHLERFMPEYQLAQLPPTPQATLEKARQIGLDAGLRFVYISNLAPHEGNHSYCPGCRKAVIRRLGFKVLGNDLRDGRCPHCGMAWPGLWS
jgi:pyruvate formate lyase activating enzyme